MSKRERNIHVNFFNYTNSFDGKKSLVIEVSAHYKIDIENGKPEDAPQIIKELLDKLNSIE